MAAALALIALTAPGCARALKEPPSIADLAGGGAPAPPEAVDGLLARAGDLFATRSLEKVREAAQVWLRAAQADPNRTEGLVGAARACVWIADHDADDAARKQAAGRAVQAAQWCRRIEPESAACFFWLGAALGVQARERPATGLDALPQIVDAFRQAASIDPNLEDAGPDRALALLYVRAPGWPTGPGDPDLGLEHARKAISLEPDFPPNQLALAEALDATGDAKGGRAAASRALDLARDRAAQGEPDAPEWVEEAKKALKSPGGV